MTSPESKIGPLSELEKRSFTLQTGGVSGCEYKVQLSKMGVNIATLGLDSIQLQNPLERETATIGIYRIKDDLNIHDPISIPDMLIEVKKKVKEHGLTVDYCTLDTAPSLLINQAQQVPEGWTVVPSIPFIDSGYQLMFVAYRLRGYLGLHDRCAGNLLHPDLCVALRFCQVT